MLRLKSIKRNLATLLLLVAAATMQAQNKHTVVEQMPTFPGGNTALISYVNNEMNYPKDCMKNKIDGRVSLNFLVTSQGDIRNVIIVRSSGNRQLDNEALRIVKQMPKWNPGKQDGKAVPVSYALPIVFKLNNASNRKFEFPSTSDIKHVEVDKYHDLAIVTLKSGKKQGFIVSETPKLKKLISKQEKENNITPNSQGYYDFFLQK